MLLSQSVAAEEPEAQKEPNHCMVKGERYFPLVHIWQGEVRRGRNIATQKRRGFLLLLCAVK